MKEGGIAARTYVPKWLRVSWHPAGYRIDGHATRSSTSAAFADTQRKAVARSELGIMSDFNNAGAASSDYLQLFGLTALTYMWALMAKVALEKKGDDPFYDDKVLTGKYYVSRVLPEAAAHLAKLKTGAELMMALPADRF